MPSTFSQICLHIVFSTKKRTPWITAAVQERIYRYISGIVRAENGKVLEIGGVEDHVHLLVSWRTDEAVAVLMRVLKSKSSKWIHETYPDLSEFAWQKGYSVFSVSKSKVDIAQRYIERQREHHGREDFRAELKRLLTAHGIEFDERYIVD